MPTYRLHDVVISSARAPYALLCADAIEHARRQDFVPGRGCSSIQCLCMAEDEPGAPVFPVRAATPAEADTYWDQMARAAGDSFDR